jgi:hypothetical protein
LVVEAVPRHPDNTNAYSMVVVTNKRPDGRFQYKVTLPKRLGDAAMSGAIPVTGEFSLSEVGYGHDDPTVVFRLDRYRNPSADTQRNFMAAEWTKLVCPFCNQEAEPPLFPEGAEPISHKMAHDCGSHYYADRSDLRSARKWEEIKGTGSSWRIVHNYHVLLGKVASNLPADFDVDDGGTMLCHVIFLAPTSNPSAVDEDTGGMLKSKKCT